MNSQNTSIQNLKPLLATGRSLIVGTLHESYGLSLVTECTQEIQSSIDILEVRLDCVEKIALPSRFPLPVIATARDPAEGGYGNLPVIDRSNLLLNALSWASAVDLELRSVAPLTQVILDAHQQGRTVILSYHDFIATPSVAYLNHLASCAANEGADLFKVATLLRDHSDVQKLIEFQMTSSLIPRATMGMGGLGRFSRLVLSGFGAALCYGWLGKPHTAGQWPALNLRKLLTEIFPESH